MTPFHSNEPVERSQLTVIAQEAYAKRKQENPEPHHSMAAADFSALVALIEEIKHSHDPKEPEDEDAIVSPVPFSKSITLGNLLAIGTVIASGFAGYYGIKGDIERIHDSVKTNSTEIHNIVDDREKYRNKYLPMIESQDKINDKQDLRMQNLGESVLQLRDAVADLAKTSKETHEDMAVMKILLQRSLPAAPVRP